MVMSELSLCESEEDKVNFCKNSGFMSDKKSSYHALASPRQFIMLLITSMEPLVLGAKEVPSEYSDFPKYCFSSDPSAVNY